MRLSPNFNLIEFACRCGCGGEQAPEIVANLMRVAAMLEKVRQACGGKPLHVTSGYRCPKHNANVGGAKASLHLTGKAADVTCATLSPVEVQRIARGVPEVHGLGLGKTFTHLDVRGHRVEFPY
jgi:uncharacterized protein YcbK (DUF882 family)